MTTSATDSRLAVVLADGQNGNLEIHYPRLRLIEAGWKMQVAAAGAEWLDDSGFVVDGSMVPAQDPDDPTDFIAAILGSVGA